MQRGRQHGGRGEMKWKEAAVRFGTDWGEDLDFCLPAVGMFQEHLR